MIALPAGASRCLRPCSFRPWPPPSRPVRSRSDADVDLIKGLQFRNIGPAVMGGSIDDFAVVEVPSLHVHTRPPPRAGSGRRSTTASPSSRSSTIRRLSSIGDIAVAPSDPSIPSTREPASQQPPVVVGATTSYKSRDGGRTWTNVGLRDTSTSDGWSCIRATRRGRRRRPRPLWGPNRERGLFKTTDGGRT